MTVRPLSGAISILLLMMLAAPAPAAAEEYSEAVHYERISPAQPTSDPTRIEVLEVFWYGCPHCYDFEPYLGRWLKNKPEDVHFTRMPGVFRPNWVPHARAYFTAETLGVLDRVHLPLFEEIHQNEKAVDDQAALQAFFVKQGIAAEDFARVYDSFAVDGKIRNAMAKGAAYGIQGVPSVIVNGKYRSSGSLAGNYDTLMKIVDYLIQKERDAGSR
jgi:thiol:disulfide interchange protein DsbA